jgi:hypothetical protein
MTPRRFQAVLCALMLMPPMQRAWAQTTKQADTASSAQRFTQRFYDWYTQIARSVSADSYPVEFAIKRKPEVFSKPLLAALRADVAARSQGKGENDGLDFDPFLFTNDPCERYQAGRVSRQHNSYSVNIHAVCAGELTDSVYVVAEIKPTGGIWHFVNFHYPQNHDDLIGVLRVLSEQRRGR